jgi:pantoate--beta-alanine ligase
MQIYKEKQALRELINTFKKEGFSIGFVPTMGALHQGHISLVKQALASCDRVVASIFVNPTQFDNPNDLEKYPRTFEEDMILLKNLDENIIIFSPRPSEIYGNEVSPEHFSFDGLEFEMEGKYRKGHFDGVGTVIKKLFEIVNPDKAFFGEKDFQQLQIIRKLTEKNHWNTEIIGCPIDRETNGLARSSRNERLSPEERQKAAFIYQTLQQVKKEFGIKSVPEVTSRVKELFDQNPGLKLEYFEIANEATLKSIQEPVYGEKYRAFIAAYSGDIRLIDNVALN